MHIIKILIELMPFVWLIAIKITVKISNENRREVAVFSYIQNVL